MSYRTACRSEQNRTVFENRNGRAEPFVSTQCFVTYLAIERNSLARFFLLTWRTEALGVTFDHACKLDWRGLSASAFIR